MITIVHEDNLAFLVSCASGVIDLIYIDPPFNTGKTRKHRRISNQVGYVDNYTDYLGFLRPRLVEAKRVLKPNGSLFFHIDPRESHYCKVLLDEIFGRKSYINEIIWSYDFGGRSKTRWSPKHDVIFWYAKNPNQYTFNFDEIDRIPYMAKGFVGSEKIARGKTPTDSWWSSIVGTNSRERTGYATQKPLKILRRIVRVHSNPGDLLLDFFAGSGSFGVAAEDFGRDIVLVDSDSYAVETMRRRFGIGGRVDQ